MKLLCLCSRYLLKENDLIDLPYSAIRRNYNRSISDENEYQKLN